MRGSAPLALLVVVALPSAVHAEPKPKTVVGFVISDGPMPRASRATTALTFDKALKQDDRLRAMDKDLQLAQRGGAVPKDVAAEARGLLATGEALLKKGRPGDALSRLTAAESQLERVLPYVKKRELARAQFLVGVANAMRGKKDDARAAFVRLLTWRPDFEVDTSLAPGQTIPRWEDAKKTLADLPTSTVRIRSKQNSALAYVDGEFVGFTPTSKKNLIVGTHYVTIRSEGYQRQIHKVAVEPDNSTHVRADLEASPRHDEMAAAVEAASKRLGDQRISVPMATLHELLGVDQGVFIKISGDDYSAYVYDLRKGRRLAHATLTISENDDPDAKLVHLAEALYAEVFRVVELDTPIAKPPVDRPGGAPFYKKWWFWTGVGVVATAVAVPLLLPEGEGDGSGPALCPAGHTCGDVIFSF